MIIHIHGSATDLPTYLLNQMHRHTLFSAASSFRFIAFSCRLCFLKASFIFFCVCRLSIWSAPSRHLGKFLRHITDANRPEHNSDCETGLELISHSVSILDALQIRRQRSMFTLPQPSHRLFTFQYFKRPHDRVDDHSTQYHSHSLR